ncbi:hypothetical protein [Lysobacter gummosus]|uniref:hypothetical protein n=1 Tax=Lysobacter gummosus TaxID=262324 RepID=UPI00363DB1E9
MLPLYFPAVPAPGLLIGKARRIAAAGPRSCLVCIAACVGILSARLTRFVSSANAPTSSSRPAARSHPGIARGSMIRGWRSEAMRRAAPFLPCFPYPCHRVCETTYVLLITSRTSCFR